MPVIFWAKELKSLYSTEESFKPSFGRLLHKQEHNMRETSEVTFVWDFNEWSMESPFYQWMKGGVKGEEQDSRVCAIMKKDRDGKL